MAQNSTFFCDPTFKAEYPVRFRFPMRWSYLSGSDPNTTSTPPRFSGPILYTARIPTEGDVSPAPTEKDGFHLRPTRPDDPESKQWEMVIPKMARSEARPPQHQTAKPASAAHLKMMESAYQAPRTTIRFEPLLSRLAQAAPSLGLWGFASAAVVVGIICMAGIALAPKTAATPVSVIPSAHWLREPALFAAGSRQRRQLVLYRGGTQPTDFRAEFDWKPNAKGAGLLFRCTDDGNYQALRIGVASWQPSLDIVEEHFTVLDGIETTHSRKLLPWKSASTPIRFVLEGTDFAFTLYAQGNRVDYWTDDRLKHGDVGFYEDRGGQPLESIRWNFANHLIADFSGPLPEIDKTLQ